MALSQTRPPRQRTPASIPSPDPAKTAGEARPSGTQTLRQRTDHLRVRISMLQVQLEMAERERYLRERTERLQASLRKAQRELSEVQQKLLATMPPLPPSGSAGRLAGPRPTRGGATAELPQRKAQAQPSVVRAAPPAVARSATPQPALAPAVAEPEAEGLSLLLTLCMFAPLLLIPVEGWSWTSSILTRLLAAGCAHTSVPVYFAAQLTVRLALLGMGLAARKTPWAPAIPALSAFACCPLLT